MAAVSGPSLLPAVTLFQGTTTRSVAVAGVRRTWTTSAVWRLVTSRLVVITAVALFALTLRLISLSSAYDLFIDEITYTNVALSLAHGHGLLLYGQPFLLHPPAALALYALIIRAFDLHGGTEAVLFELRPFVAVLGSATCVLSYLLVERAATRRLAIVVAAMLALDPLVISFDSRVMLEAPAQLATVSAFFLVAVADRRPPGSLTRWSWLTAAGLMAATGLCTKETFGLVIMGTLGLMAATGWVVARREALFVIALALIGYALCVVAQGVSIGFAAWWQAKDGGVLRLVGLRQVTGFNSADTHVSFVSRVLADATTYGVSYLVLVAGCLAGLGMLWSLRPWARRTHERSGKNRTRVLISLWTVSAAAYLVYATVFGTIEEQMYYILLLPALMSVCLFVGGITWNRNVLRKLGVAVLCAALLVDIWVWLGVHRGSDDEYRQMLSWEARHVPPTSVVSATDGTSQFLLSRGIIGQWSTVSALRGHRVDYVILATGLVEQGYGIAGPAFERTLDRRARLVFVASGVSDGSLRVYDVRGITGAGE